VLSRTQILACHSPSDNRNVHSSPERRPASALSFKYVKGSLIGWVLPVVVADDTDPVCDAADLTDGASEDDVLESETRRVEVAMVSSCYSCAELSIVVALCVAAPHQIVVVAVSVNGCLRLFRPVTMAIASAVRWIILSSSRLAANSTSIHHNHSLPT